MSEYNFELWQHGMMVAAVTADDEQVARREITHYAAMYSEDGPVEIRQKIKRARRKAGDR